MGLGNVKHTARVVDKGAVYIQVHLVLIFVPWQQPPII
jgi:hypothetical protein